MTFLAAEGFFYRGIPRWDFGLDNPNKAAAILALVLLLLLSASMRARREWARWCWSVLAAVAGCCLVHTFSRGGMVAFFAGATVLFLGLRNDLRVARRWVPILLVAIVTASAALWTGFAGRMAHSSPSVDASVGNRLELWRNVPAMMVDAPGGWGRGMAGDMYMGWYQPLDRSERYRTLVNSHFTWLVEMGWTGRLCYVCGFALLFAMGGIRLKVRGDPLPLSVLTCFATAAFFSSVAEEWTVCVVPLAMLAPMLKTFVFEAPARIRWTSLAVALLGGCVLLGGVGIVGVTCRPSGGVHVHKSYDGARLVVGRDEPSAWVVCDSVVMGERAHGRLLRMFANTREGHGISCGMVDDLAALPGDVRHLALCGKAADAGPSALAQFASLADVRVISPSSPREWLSARAKMPYIRVFCGEFSPSCPEEDAEGLTVVVGAAEYLPGWPRIAFADVSPQK